MQTEEKETWKQKIEIVVRQDEFGVRKIGGRVFER